MRGPEDTTPSQLRAAAAIGCASGLRYVYAGNLPGGVGDLEHTRCASCQRVLIARFGYDIREYNVTEDGRCPACNTPVPGRWDRAFAGQIASQPFLPQDRSRRAWKDLPRLR
jgi:pyruvate formate lyase activating enzyme